MQINTSTKDSKTPLLRSEGKMSGQTDTSFLYPYAESSSSGSGSNTTTTDAGEDRHHHHHNQQNHHNLHNHIHSSSSTSDHGCRFIQSFDSFLSPELVRKVVAEVIATYLLVFVTCGTAAISSVNEQQLSKLGASVAGGLIVTVMIYAVGHISGAHMNPAVTIAFTASRRFPLKQVPFYAAAQLTGAISAGFTLRVLLDPSIKLLGTTSPSGSDIQALLMEVIVTFCMMFVTSAVATDAKARGELAGVAVGSSVCITSILAGPISGGSMNPARTIGPALASGYYKGLWIYIVGPILGTLLGIWAYSLVRGPASGVASAATLPRHHNSETTRLNESKNNHNNDVVNSKEMVEKEEDDDRRLFTCRIIPG